MDDLAARAARVRAARAYADIDQKPFASALGWSPRTLARVESGEKTDIGDDLQKISELTGVPLAFLAYGFTREGNGDTAITELRAAVTSLVAGHLQLERELREIRDRDRREPRRGDET